MARSPEHSELAAAILGAGAVGLLGAMALRAMGIDTYVYDRATPPNAKSQLVELIGAHYVSPGRQLDELHRSREPHPLHL